MPTVSGSKRANSVSPNALAAAICRRRAWMETLTAPTAILSFLVKSFNVFRLGLRVLSSSGIVASAHTPFTWMPERVLSQRVSIGGGPPTPKESAPQDQCIVHDAAAANLRINDLDLAQARCQRML